MTRDLLETLWWNGVNQVRGFHAVSNALKSQKEHEAPDLIIAVGKAAGDMALGARHFYEREIPTIIATKYDHVSDELNILSSCTILQSAHPIPDENSLASGAHLLHAVRTMPSNAKLLLLVSGGASALVEVLREGVDLPSLMAKNRSFMADGLTIGQINAERKKISKIKAGQLLEAFTGASANVIAISDVEGDRIDVIGSGIGAYNGKDNKAKITIAASNAVARAGVEEAAKAQSIQVICNLENLYGSAEQAAFDIMNALTDGPSGLYIFGGEPTVELPENPGEGGRNQHLALLLADKISGRKDIVILVAGTDGSDGPTRAAGGIVDGDTVTSSAEIAPYLKAADAGTYLKNHGALFTSGPTGTNVMDLVIALKN